MANLALLVSPDYDPLSGFANSVACIAQVLARFGFALVRCAGPDATRSGILAAYDDLIARARADDAIAIYYVGHSGLVVNRNYTGDDRVPRYLQCICPSDFAAITDTDFRAISSLELSLRLAALTRVTPNVTVILESCFAALMMRGEDPPGMQRMTPKLTLAGFTRHLEALRGELGDFDALAPAGNPDAIRVDASGQTESAFQLALPARGLAAGSGLELPPDGWIGAMTIRLAEVLTQVGDAAVSWRSIGSVVRSRLTVQRPQIEGPVTRVPFSLRTVDAELFSVRSRRDTALVDAGRLAGISVGDVYGVMPAGSTRLDPTKLIERITIGTTSMTQSTAPRRAWQAGAAELPPGAVALPIALAFAPYPVRVVASAAERAVVAQALAGAGRVRVATDDDRELLAELRVEGGRLELRDELGPLFPAAAFPGRLGDAVKDLENLATARRLRELPELVGMSPRDARVELCRLDGDDEHPLADHGERLALLDRLTVRVTNRSSEVRFVHVFNVGLRQAIARLNPDADGDKLEPGATFSLGLDQGGIELSWSEGLPADQPRVDTLLVVLTSKHADLSMLETTEQLGTRRDGAAAPPAGFTPFATGQARGAAAPNDGTFAVIWRDYRLFPLDASLDAGTPQIDASPAGRAGDHGARLRIALRALRVRPGARLDVLVCARSRAAYRATTLRVERADLLEIWGAELDELHGPAELHVFVSRGGAGPTLPELLAAHAPAAPVALLQAPPGDPRGLLAPGASLQLAAIARAALRALDPAVVTAFRGTVGAPDAAGHAYATPDVSFALEVTRLEDVVITGAASPT